MPESLRLAKKTRTRDSLLEQAQRGVRSQGVSAGFRIREVAEAAGVSEASFYNYFGNREALLSEWAHRLVAGAFAAAGAGPSAGALRRRLREPLRELARAVAAEQGTLQPVWRHATLRPDVSAPGAPVPLFRAAEELVLAAQRAGELRADLPAGELAALLHTAAMASIAHWLEAADPQANAGGLVGAADLEGSLHRAVDLVLDGGRKRNERIRPGRGASRSAPPGAPIR